MRISQVESKQPSFIARLYIQGNCKGLPKADVAKLMEKVKGIGTELDSVHIGMNKYLGGVSGRPITIIQAVKGCELPTVQHCVDAPYRNNAELLKKPFKIIEEYIDMISTSLKEPKSALAQHESKKEYYDLAREMDLFNFSRPFPSFSEYLFGKAKSEPCPAEKKLIAKLGMK